MNTRILLIAITLTAGLLFSTCKKEEEEVTPKPVITLTELGHENSKVGHPGEDFHIEAEIVAEGKIDKVQVTIHPKEHDEKSGDYDEWEVDTVYTKFSGLMNTEFHEHIEVCDSAELGHYYFHLIVTDKEGQQTSVEKEIEIKEETTE